MPDRRLLSKADRPHRHGWDCFRTSGGYTNAMELSTPLAERIEAVYRTAYATGFKNGRQSMADEIGPYMKIQLDTGGADANSRP